MQCNEILRNVFSLDILSVSDYNNGALSRAEMQLIIILSLDCVLLLLHLLHLIILNYIILTVCIFCLRTNKH